jgi:hypothetical protein
MIDKFGLMGRIEIEILDINTGKKQTIKSHNRIMNAGINELMSALIGTAPDIEMAYMAIGTGTTAITDTDTVLDTETFRCVPSTAPYLNSTGEIITEFKLQPAEGVGTITEWGFFVGSTASATVDTGTLWARLLKTVVKTNAQAYTIKRIDKAVRA